MAENLKGAVLVPREILEAATAEARARFPEYTTNPDHGRAANGYQQGFLECYRRERLAAVSLTEREAGEEAQLEAGRYLSGYQQSAVARALVKVGKMGLNDTQSMLRDALSRQASALDTIRAAANAWDETMRAEVENILQCCGLHPLQPASAASPTRKGSSEWVPVGERLPEIDSRVLVCWDGTRTVTTARYLTTDQWGRNDMFVVDGGFNEAKHFTHWMPLPTPPQP